MIKTACFCLIFCMFPGIIHPHMGNRVMEQSPLTVQWDKPDTLELVPSENQFIIKLGNQDHAWLSTIKRYPLSPATTLSLNIASTQAMLQLEWFTSADQFLGATDVLKAEALSTGLQSVDVMAQLPADLQGKAKRFRPKFWLFVKESTHTIKEFSITARRSFRKNDVLPQHVWLPKSKLTADAPLTLKLEGDMLHITMNKEVDHAGLVFEDRVDYNPRGTVMIDILSITPQTGLTVQLLCWDETGKYIQCVDLLKNLKKEGTFEISPGVFGSAIPAGTAQISFKVWVLGKDAQCTLGGLFWGVPMPANGEL